MNDLISTKMDEWRNTGDNVSMFKFTSMLYITAPDSQESKLEEIQEYAECIASTMNDIELARAKKEIEQLMEQEK
jgi:hypothetical protein